MTETHAYRISHVTTYTYDSPVRVCHNLVMLTPRSDWVVKPLGHRVTVKPHPMVMHRREDYFGNTVHAFSIEESHRQLTVTASGRVEVAYDPLPPPEQSLAWEQVRNAVWAQTDLRWLEACQFRFNSERIQTSVEMADYARQSFRPGQPILAAALDLTRRIYDDFAYDTAATTVHTTPHEAFALRRGVCQDFAHIQVACLRSLGLSARYVSGYLRTYPPAGQPRLVGADQSHAWVSIYCGQQLGWVDLDPTNNRLCNIDHIPIAWGRDYNDVVPIRGVFLGGGQHGISVAVDVSPV
jgi:transglutaminase-like putative cysteine protease